MKIRAGVFLMVVWLPWVAACGGEAGDEAGEAPSGSVQETTVQDACEILTESLIRQVFEVGDREISFSSSDRGGYPACYASWEKPNAQELEEEMGRKMQEYMSAKLRGEDVEMPDFSAQNQAHLVLNPKNSAEGAEAAFASMIKMLEEGITSSAEVKGKEYSATFRASYDRKIDDVGDQAAWTNQLSQLSVQDGAMVFHVGVNVGDDSETNLKLARELASEVIPQL